MSVAAPNPLAGVSDHVPILLMPVRIETRFRPAGSGLPGSTGPQLWIRIYPDACSIDSFEPQLTASEIAVTAAFWIATWRAGGVDADARGAWRALLGSAGAGRAAYLVAQYAPTNPTDRPTKARPQDIVLVIAPQPSLALTDAERATAIAYWTVVWHADGDAPQVQGALAALSAAVGGDARAQQIIAGFAPDPAGWDPPAPDTRATVGVQIATIALPPAPAAAPASWTRAPIAAALPDHFVALGFTGATQTLAATGASIPAGLATGPDPSAPISETDGDLQLDAKVAWLGDFPRAVAVGMAMAVDLTTEVATNGLDRLIVLGVRTSATAAQGQQLIEQLIAHQAATKAGYGLVPQGTPTTNTDAGTTHYSWIDDPDATFDLVFGNASAYADSADPLAKRDGQWLAEALGIDGALVRTLANAAGTDQLEARAMNTALWNATGGYMLDSLLAPLVSAADSAATRAFFVQNVSGRGPLPALRVGDQPYGVLPAISLARYNAATSDGYAMRLRAVIASMTAEWTTLAAGTSHVGASGDPLQTLLDILGLQPGSVEFYQRYADGLDLLYNKYVLEAGVAGGTALVDGVAARRTSVLHRLQANTSARPQILETMLFGASSRLTGPIVDDAALSETAPIRPYAPDGDNYLAWLARASLDQIRRQDFGGRPEPTSLLYLLARHAMMLCQWDAGVRLLAGRGLADLAVARAEPPFIHVHHTAGTASESRFAAVYAPAPTVTGSATLPLAEYVRSPTVLQTAPETEDLRSVVAALTALAGVPTARLERAFTEHVDCCAYRLDAWRTGLAASRLAELRTPFGAAPTQGLYLGGFGWLENVRPRAHAGAPVALSADLAGTFQRPGDAPLVSDPSSSGYVHAPSLSQAAAAAVLRTAYDIHATPSTPNSMAVDLSSTRVRHALEILEGVRTGQTLSALLGYRFERGLHDAHGLAEIDAVIYPLRQAFPLVANQLANTRTDGTVDIELLEARNVIDGVALVTRMATDGAAYPFGLPTGGAPGQLPAVTADQASAIDIEAARLRDLYDAIGDLALAEGVYQVVLGNFDRAAAVATTFGSGGHPPSIQIVDTPQTGLTLTHRVALHLDASADPETSPNAVSMTPRARADAAVNSWLSSRLPAPDAVVVQVSYSAPASPTPATVALSLADLGLQAIDLLAITALDLDSAQGSMTELDDRIAQAIRYGSGLGAHPDVSIAVDYEQPVAGKISLFELAPLLRELRTLILGSRALGSTDVAAPPVDASAAWDIGNLGERVAAATAGLTTVRDALATAVASGGTLDDLVLVGTVALLDAARHGVPQTGTSQIHRDVRAIYDAIAAKVRAVMARWTQRAADYTALFANWDALTSNADRTALVAQAERLVAPQTTAKPPTDPAAYRAAVDTVAAQQAATTTQLSALLAWSGARLVDFAAAVVELVPSVAQHDDTPLDLAAEQTAIDATRARLATRLAAVAADVTARIADATTAIAAAMASTDASQTAVTALQAVGRRVLGGEAMLVPHFTLRAADGAVFAQALAGSDALLDDLRTAGRRFPLDDWMYGVARVRSKLHAWEASTVLAELLGAPPAELVPTQLPVVANDRWQALDFDVSTAPQTDRLLYTAHLASPFDAVAAQCGLLVDEWHEVVPATELVSGLAVHVERPRSQPPQAMLLAVPPVVRGTWQWSDLVATVLETLDAAKSRAVEPAQIDATGYAQILPATLIATTLYQVTIATNLGINNDVYARLEKA